MKNTQLENCKTETIFFADCDGYVYFCFGQTEEVILCERLQENPSREGEFTLSPLVKIPHSRFDRIVKREDVIVCGGQVTYKVRKKRQSTTAKVTRKTKQLIEGYVVRTGNGVIIRHKGKEIGVAAENLDTLPPANECTILKTTIETLQKWHDRYSAISDLINSDRNGTAGIPSHRYVVSRNGGVETISLRSLTPYVVSRFIDDTLAAECAGLWKSEDGVYCLDSNVSFERLPTAIEFGRSHNQIAIFDTVTGTEVLC